MLTKLQKLKMLMTAIKKKQAAGLPLSPSEANLVAEMNRLRLMKPSSTLSLETDGSVVFKRSHMIDPIIDGVKEMSDMLPRHHEGAAGGKYVGSIDSITALNWAKEWGVKLYTKEFNKLAARRIKQDSDYRKFKYTPVH